MIPPFLRGPSSLNNYAYGSFTSQGPVTALGSALKAFWTADDHGTANMTDDGSGLISAWKDQVGGLTLTAATTARPTWSATSFNGAFAGVTADGTANAMSVAATTGLPTGTAECWIIALVSQPSDSSTRTIFGYGSGSAGADRKIQKSTTDRYAISDTTTDLLTHSASELLIGKAILATRFVSGGGSIEGYFNSRPTSPASISATFNTATTRTRMFSALGASTASLGNATLRYVMVTGALTALQRQQIDGWMCHTSGRLAPYLLPNTHPFRSRKP